MPGSALLLDGVCVDAPRARLLHGLTLTLAPGERVALLGASGSGKSVTAGAVLGTLPPDLRVSGRVEVDRSALAWVPQSGAAVLHPLRRVGSQLRRPLRARGDSPAAACAAAARLVERLGLDPEPTLRAFPHELSGGQRQRVGIALALALPARVVVADEPTSALDGVAAARVREALDGLDAALLLITHDLALAAALCDRLLVLDDGRLVDDVDWRRWHDTPRAPAATALLEATHRLAGGAR
ncbi:ATP-binding cassette domain-containing protein [Nocardioides sp.]|uniref:ATP-binding cassette domain-containing protein n=1 Tax=Nocardioides sp. TaxID=35761 RepID=UPI0035192AE5